MRTWPILLLAGASDLCLAFAATGAQEHVRILIDAALTCQVTATGLAGLLARRVRRWLTAMGERFAVQGNPVDIGLVLMPLDLAARFVLQGEQWTRFLAWLEDHRDASCPHGVPDPAAKLYQGLEDSEQVIRQIIRKLPDVPRPPAGKPEG